MKPDPEIFRLAVERAGCRPEECFYTDDIAAYTAAAREQGIDAVTFESASQIERELAARGIRLVTQTAGKGAQPEKNRASGEAARSREDL